MRRWLLLLALAVVGPGCSTTKDMADLDREYGHFRYEQEKYRREDLEKLYEAERARSDELTRRILALRREIEEQERTVEELERRRTGQ